ncbi:hypothetical protein O181_036656 [Austropuccinia psidii MF-1]|uniref:Uncharacterized protein n=1 Tax=Austropuccinia psidii MF-1 TaxID=1389203 RepID=A0A9Q3DAL4_9BASI|nr:hypothetical protein [Austropuccinia psidii MF-1]
MSLFRTVFLAFFLSSTALSAPPPTSPKQLVNDNAIVVNATICEHLSALVKDINLVEAACLASNLTVNTRGAGSINNNTATVGNATTATNATNAAAVVNATIVADVNAFITVMSGCNSVSVDLEKTLSDILNNVVSLTKDVVGHVLVPTLVTIDGLLKNFLVSLNNVEKCTDAQLARVVYAAFVVFAEKQKHIGDVIAAKQAIIVDLQARISLHAELVQLEATIKAFVDSLFKFISADLDTLKARASLLASIKAAVFATATANVL